MKTLTLEEVENELSIKNTERFELENAKKAEINKLEAEKYLPLIAEAERVRTLIRKDVFAKYKDATDKANRDFQILTEEYERLKGERSKSLWYPVGTKLVEWKQRSYSGKWMPTGKTGTVQIYDGTQELPNNLSHYDMPQKGAIVVFYNRKDGTMGKLFKEITRYDNTILGRAKYWFPEGEVPKEEV